MEDMLFWSAEDARKYKEGFADGVSRAIRKIRSQILLLSSLDNSSYDDLLEYLNDMERRVFDV